MQKVVYVMLFHTGAETQNPVSRLIANVVLNKFPYLIQAINRGIYDFNVNLLICFTNLV